MKYVVIEVPFGVDGDMKRSFGILFPNDLTHSQVAQALMDNCPELKEGIVAGAGELSCMDISPNCHGNSVSLEIESRGKQDDAAFRMRDYNGGLI